MHITALCPFCRTAYQVQATLRGQTVRCPNAACRKAFAVPMDEKSTAAPPSAPPGNGRRSGSVGDFVPMLQAEQATPPAETKEPSQHVSEMIPVVSPEPASDNRPAEGAWWQAAPPVRATPSKPAAPVAPSAPIANSSWWSETPPAVNKTAAPITKEKKHRKAAASRPAAETQPMPLAPLEKGDARKEAEAPRELPPGVWEPPPVRRGDAATTENVTATPAEKPTDEVHKPRVGKRGAVVLIAALFFLTFGVLGGVGAWVWVKFHASEKARFDEARAHYKQDSYSIAANEYRELAQKFAESTHVEDYRFLADWCGVCAIAADPDADSATAVAKVEQFVKEHKKDPLMIELAHDAGQLTLKLTKTFAARNAAPTDAEPLKVAEKIDELRHTVAGLGSDALSKEESGQVDVVLDTVRRAVEVARQRHEVLAQIQPRNKETPMEALHRVRALLARRERELPGIGQDPEARVVIAKLEDAHLASVVYRADNEDAVAPQPRLEDDAASLLFAPLLPTAAPGRSPPNDPVVLALVRGVLYALKQSNGELKWATRVGIDTTVLPQRVPASQASPELMLVLSADTQTLSALGTEGDPLWEYRVGQPVLGRPILIDRRAYLAAYDGSIHEIELAGGKLLGRWSLGQRLTCGGAREGNTSRIYFPADDSCIYVLDVDPKVRRCVTILYDGHPSGSLRSEPVVIPPEGDTAPGYLILNRASGLDAMSLRVFELPLQDRHAAEIALNPPARFSGWTWFAPKQDGEKLAIVSDAGILGLFGIRQQGNQDQALFPVLQAGGLDLSPFLRSERALPSARGRAQVVSMQGDDLWLLAHGRLQQLELRLAMANGPQAAPRWPRPLTLGSPLHEAQRVEDRNTGLSTFFLVTQALEQQTCLASAVDEQGKILWQRQLGLVCRDEPLTLTPPSGGSSLLVALDRGGGLFALDPAQTTDEQRPRYLAPALDENPLVPPYLLSSPDGHSAYEIAVPGEGRTLLVRHIGWSNDERSVHVITRELSLLSPAGNSVRTLAGPPVVSESQLLLPMTDGNLMRLSLSDERSLLQTGPTWRDSHVPVTANCDVLSLGGDRVLATDGGRKLAVWEWPHNKDWRVLPKEGDLLKPLEYLPATPPVLLPSRDNVPPRVAIGDSANVLHLFVVGLNGALQPGSTWPLKGKITAGPFVRTMSKGAMRLGCILDRRRLVWFDPDKAEPLWTYSSKDEAILDQPQLIEDFLVMALQSGRYVAVDPNTGQPKGAGYTLRTSAAPAAAPTPFGSGRMFAPLSDGTALLLSLDKVTK